MDSFHFVVILAPPHWLERCSPKSIYKDFKNSEYVSTQLNIITLYFRLHVVKYSDDNNIKNVELNPYLFHLLGWIYSRRQLRIVSYNWKLQV